MSRHSPFFLFLSFLICLSYTLSLSSTPHNLRKLYKTKVFDFSHIWLIQLWCEGRTSSVVRIWQPTGPEFSDPNCSVSSSCLPNFSPTKATSCTLAHTLSASNIKITYSLYATVSSTILRQSQPVPYQLLSPSCAVPTPSVPHLNPSPTLLFISFVPQGAPAGKEYPLVIKAGDDMESEATAYLMSLARLQAPLSNLPPPPPHPDLISSIVQTAQSIIAHNDHVKLITAVRLAHIKITNTALNLALGSSPDEMTSLIDSRILLQPLPTSANTLDVTSWDSFSQYSIQYNTVHSMVAEHVWEHLSLQEAINAARNCRFALKPDGVLLVAVPDVNSYVGTYDIDESGDTRYHPMDEADIRDGHTTQYDFKLLTNVFLSGGWGEDEIRIVEGHDASGKLFLDYPEPPYPIKIDRSHANGRNGPGSSLIIQLVKKRASSTGREPYFSREACMSHLPLPMNPPPSQVTLLAKCFKATADPLFIEPVATLSDRLSLPQISLSLQKKIRELMSSSPAKVFNAGMARISSSDHTNDSTLLRPLNRHALLSSAFGGQHLFDEWRNIYDSLLSIGQPCEALRILRRVVLEDGGFGEGEYLRLMQEAKSLVTDCDGGFGRVLLNGDPKKAQNFGLDDSIYVTVDLRCMANKPLQNENAGIVPCSHLVADAGSDASPRFSNCAPQYSLSSLPAGSYRIVVEFFSQPAYEEIAGSRVELNFTVGRPSSPAFWKAPAGSPSNPPIVFFTLLLNGLPYLHHHYPTFSAAAKALNTTFQWHIVEGVAEGRADARNPYSQDAIDSRWKSDRNLSSDGSSQVVDELQNLHPGSVFVHRKSDGSVYRDKLQMVNEVAYSLDFDCILVQVDVDEIWSPSMIQDVYRLLDGAKNGKNCAYFDCHFLVGPKIVTTGESGGWGHAESEWLRAWKFKPLSFFLSHAPPVLVEEANNGGWRAVDNCVGKEKTRELGIVFSHYAYYEEKQAEFKSLFYGYGREGVEGWRGMQHAEMPQKAGAWLPWLREGAEGYEERFEKTMVDRVEVMEEKLGVKMVNFGREIDSVGDSLTRTRDGVTEGSTDCAYTTLIDGVIFQVTPKGGISRVWKEVLDRLPSNVPSSHCLVLLLRGGEGEEVSKALKERGGNWKFVKGPLYNKDSDFERDSLMLASMCKKYSAHWFLSTLYTFPTKELAPDVKVGFIIHDLTPELFGWEGGIWDQKKRAIAEHSDAIFVVSNSTRAKLEEIYKLREGVELVSSRNGIDPKVFYRRDQKEVEGLKMEIGLDLNAKYVLLVGERRGYKSGHTIMLTLKSAKQANMEVPTIVMVGGGVLIEEELEMLDGMKYLHIKDGVDDDTLAKLYSGATALAYLSVDEGFGLPVVEAMACDCGLILSDINVFKEVTGGERGGARVRFVNPAFPEEIWGAVVEFMASSQRGASGNIVEFHGGGWDKLAEDVAKVVGEECPYFVSQQGQDIWADAVFGTRGDRYFVELGANDGVTLSNTLGLEKCRVGRWRGLCIEPTAAYEELMESGRDRCVKVKEAVAGGVRETELIGADGGVEGLDTGGTLWAGLRDFFDAKSEIGDAIDESSALLKSQGGSLSIITKTLQMVFEEAGAPKHIDFLSLDVEGAEVEVLGGINWEAQSFGLIAVEHGYDEAHRGEIKRILLEAGYVRARCFGSDDGYVKRELVEVGGELEGLKFEGRGCKNVRVQFVCQGEGSSERGEFCGRYGMIKGGALGEEYCEGVWLHVEEWCGRGVETHAFSAVFDEDIDIKVEIGGGVAHVKIDIGDNEGEAAKEFCELNRGVLVAMGWGLEECEVGVRRQIRGSLKAYHERMKREALGGERSETARAERGIDSVH